MKTSQRGIDLIKQFEGCRLRAYKAHFSEKYYTIGYGHYGPDVSKDMVISEAQAEKMLKSDLQSYEDKVNKYDSKYHWNQNEFDALVSFCYNIGNIDQLTKNGTRNRQEIKDKIPAYCNCNGYKLLGLVRRRAQELILFSEPVVAYPVPAPSQDPKVQIPEPTLRRRCKNQRVVQLQHACNVLFGKDIEEDGSYGPITQQTIKDIQKASGKLESDGIYGPKTYKYFMEVACK